MLHPCHAKIVATLGPARSERSKATWAALSACRGWPRRNYTTSGASVLRMAREWHVASIPGITPNASTARRLALVWDVQPVLSPVVDRMTRLAIDTTKRLGCARTGQTLVIAAGMPFGTSGSTNLLRIAEVD
ncbi:MAG: pyruvate kinase alpha/beta domain-containing protein [Hydrogenophaga sp.]|uniref:pyruvate kinase alpha/beta domain-containing protein n=1 Tax=Hydrogenophaga sp. TaxID=1904254 RepID=UPI002AB8E32B|nr:pyruvate kinase alpha/beta domain-containing protein [Hydrogenophaga sp.]MDZ4188184.1 pyruvate kinase alpha/beta domain-containing protein [Hydrogenophaga sp.]